MADQRLTTQGRTRFGKSDPLRWNLIHAAYLGCPVFSCALRRDFLFQSPISTPVWDNCDWRKAAGCSPYQMFGSWYMPNDRIDPHLTRRFRLPDCPRFYSWIMPPLIAPAPRTVPERGDTIFHMPHAQSMCDSSFS